jgi:hypothetical protein
MKTTRLLWFIAGIVMVSSSHGEYQCIPYVDEECDQGQTYQKREKVTFSEDVILNQPFPDQSSEHFVSTFEDYQATVSKEIEDADEAVRKAMQKAVSELKLEAFREAATEINQILEQPLTQIELGERAKKAAGIHKKFMGKEDFKLLKQEAKKSGPFSSSVQEVIVSGFFRINRAALKEFLVDAVKSSDLQIREEDVLPTTMPSSTSQTYIASFRDVSEVVTDQLRNRAEAQARTVEVLVEGLRRKALEEAAEEINHSLAQPMDLSEFNYAIDKANRNFQDYISNWKLTKQRLEETKTYSGTKEKVRLWGWFAVDKDKLRKTLVDGRAITTVSKYRTYVEAFWNVPDKAINPDLLNTVIGNVEDHFSQKGYEVVEFERIKGDLVELLNREGEDTSDLFAQDELERFEANLNLRNVDNKFENGKRILADYADLLIGVSVTSMEVKERMVHVRITVNATLFENGEWVKLASEDRAARLPYVRGDTDMLIAVTRKVTQDAVALLEPKARKQIALRRTKEEIRTKEEREFTLVFRKADNRFFNDVRRKLKKGEEWVFKGADTKNKTVRLGFRGPIDNLADGVDDFLGGLGLSHGLPEYTRGQNRILFGGGE